MDNVPCILDFESNPPESGGSNTDPGDHDTSKSQPLICYNLCCRRANMSRKVMKK